MRKNTFSGFTVPAHFKLVFAAILCLTTLCSCGGAGNERDRKEFEISPLEPPQSGPTIPIDINNTKLGRQIRQDYLDRLHNSGVSSERDKTIDDVSIVRYYGDYNDSVPVMIHVSGQGYPQGIYCITIADVAFWVNENFITVWKEGQFYSLENAYNLNFLTQEDLRDIADLQNGTYACPNQETLW